MIARVERLEVAVVAAHHFDGKLAGKLQGPRVAHSAGASGQLADVVDERRVHAPKQRAGPAVADRAAVEHGHRQETAGGERQPDLVCAAQLGHSGCGSCAPVSRGAPPARRPRRGWCRAECDGRSAACGSRPAMITCTVVEEPSVSSPSSSRMVSNAPASTASRLSRAFASSAVDLMSRRAQRVSGAVIAATPCSSNCSDSGSSVVGVGEHRRLQSLRPGVVAAVLRAASHLQVEVLVPAAVARDQLAAHLAPFGMRQRRRHADCRRGCASSRSRCSRSRNGRPP